MSLGIAAAFFASQQLAGCDSEFRWKSSNSPPTREYFDSLRYLDPAGRENDEALLEEPIAARVEQL